MSSIVNLNVGGKRFATSKETLIWPAESFFTGLLNGGLATELDETGAIFIDRDPDLFSIILNYLRTKRLSLITVDIKALFHEAQFYGIGPLIKLLSLCSELNKSSCGDIYFDGCLESPTNLPMPIVRKSQETTNDTKEIDYDKLSVRIIRAHVNLMAVCYSHFLVCYKLKVYYGWQAIFESPYIEKTIDLVAVNGSTMQVAISFNTMLKLWSIGLNGSNNLIGTFDLSVRIENLFFIGAQLVAMSSAGKIGVWRHFHWQTQNVLPILCHDAAGSFLVLGCSNGSVCLADMQKFPLRIKDNDLLITMIYRDPNSDPITAISVFLTSKSSLNYNCLEIAYGTVSGCVRVIVQHPETVGCGPQLFQSFTVHQSPISRVTLTEKYLVSVCSEHNHVRTWRVTRFRGMISTQPGLTAEASFKIMALEASTSTSTIAYTDASKEFKAVSAARTATAHCGPFGEQQFDEQIFVEKVVPDTDKLFIRSAVDGRRICELRSIDGSWIRSFFVYEFDSFGFVGTRLKRMLFTGHRNGRIQMWDLTSAIDCSNSSTLVSKGARNNENGPSPDELIEMLESCDLKDTH